MTVIVAKLEATNSTGFSFKQTTEFGNLSAEGITAVMATLVKATNAAKAEKDGKGDITVVLSGSVDGAAFPPETVLNVSKKGLVRFERKFLQQLGDLLNDFDKP